MKALTTQEFIKNAINVHGNKYDYSKVNYINNHTDIIIICKIHGDFKQLPNNHIHNNGCPLCSYNTLKLTQKQFIEKANKIHENKYTYKNSNYINNKSKITITCPIHGEFKQKPNKHLSGEGCRKCGNLTIKNKKLKNTNTFIKNAIRINGQIYDYSKVEYKGNKNKVIVICKKHGEFMVRPDVHISKNSGCPECKKITLGILNRPTTEEFIKKAKNIHGNTYDYSKTTIKKGNKEKITITCHKHGNFMQSPNAHLRGNGCPHCNESHGEKAISNFLKNEKINYIRQVRFSECRGKKFPLPFDFYLPDRNVCIEYDGEQHSVKSNRWFNNLVSINDEIKSNFCRNKGIKLIRISYIDYNKISQILNKSLNTAIQRIV